MLLKYVNRFFLLTFLAVTPVHSAVTVTLFGTPGSPDMTYTVSGTMTASMSGNSSFTGVLLIPASNGTSSWAFPGDTNLGDFIADGTATQTFNTGLTTISLDGTTRSLDSITINASSSHGGDYVRIHNASAFTYPGLGDGEVVTYSGGGSFTLAGGNFDDVFTLGTYAANPSEYIVQVVPEPSATALLALGVISIGLVRRR